MIEILSDDVTMIVGTVTEVVEAAEVAKVVDMYILIKIKAHPVSLVSSLT
jgi:hypothetical protein